MKTRAIQRRHAAAALFITPSTAHLLTPFWHCPKKVSPKNLGGNNFSSCARSLRPNRAAHRADSEYPRRESNSHLRFRKPPFYPLNYGDNDIYDCRFSICDFKAKTVHSRLQMSVTISVPDRDGQLCQLHLSRHPDRLRWDGSFFPERSHRRKGNRPISFCLNLVVELSSRRIHIPSYERLL
jgi:hypothetical protein